MSKKAFLLSLVTSSLFLTACNDPKEANKENFGKAVSEYLATQSAVCIYYPEGYSEIPQDSELRKQDVVVVNPSSHWEKDKLAQMNYLAEHSLYSKTEQTFTIKPYSYSKAENKTFYVYTPTEAQTAFVVEKEGRSKKLCSGKVELDEIGTFTEPADVWGKHISEVNFTVKTKDIAPWAADPKLNEVFKGLLGANIAKTNDKAVLILTSEGWKSERLMRNKK